MMTRGGEGGKKCRKFDDVICERPLKPSSLLVLKLMVMDGTKIVWSLQLAICQLCTLLAVSYCYCYPSILGYSGLRMSLIVT